jgi:hypothetical protein
MYKKIKATKNNSLKKASVLASVAILASCVVLGNPEQFGLDEATNVSAFYGFGRRGKFGRKRGNWYRRGRRNPYDHNTTLMSENQRENYELFQKNVSFIANYINSSLSPSGLEDSMDPAMNVYREEVSRAADQVFRLLEETDAYKKIDLPETDSDVGASTKSVVTCINKIKKLQDTVFRYMTLLGGMLNFDRIKNADKLDKVQELAKELKCPSKLIKIANIKGVVSSSTNLKMAKRIFDKALEYYFACKTFSDDESKPVDSWRGYSFYASSSADSVNSAVRPFLTTMHTLLSINATINRIYKEFAARRTIRNMRQFLIAYYAYGHGAAVAAVNKQAFFEAVTGRYEDGNPTQPYPDFSAMPLYLASTGSAGIEVDGGSSITTNRTEFTSHLVKALGEKTSPTDLLNNFFNYADAHSTPDKTSELTVKYDLAKVLEGAIGINSTKEQLDVLDKAVEDVLKDENIKALSDINMLTSAEKKQLEESRENFKAGVEGSRYVSASGTPFSTLIDATFESQNRSQLNAILAMPEMIRGRALVEVLIKDLNSSTYNMDNWDDTLRVWIDKSSFIAGAGVAIKDISEAYQQVRTLGKKISDIKSTKSTSKEDREKTVASQLTNLIVLGSDNRNVNSTVTVKGKSIEINGLTASAISPVLCPKTASDSKTGATNVDLPLIDVVNGSATIDLDKYLTASGNYELHIREAVIGDAATKAVKAYNFLHKYKFAYGTRNVKRLAGLATNIEQADSSILDYSNVVVYQNEDKSLTFRIKAKKDARSLPDIVTGVFFKKDAPANMETDKFAVQRVENDWYEFTSTKNQEGAKQLHIYRGEVEAEKYDGKVEVEIGKTVPMAISSDDNALSDALAKGDSRSRSSFESIATTRKEVKISVSEHAFDESGLDEESTHRINYTILNSAGEKVLSGATDAEFVKKRDSASGAYDTVIYKVAIDVPTADGDYRLRLEDFAEDTLEATSSINSKTQPNTVIDTKLLHDDYY